MVNCLLLGREGLSAEDEPRMGNGKTQRGGLGGTGEGGCQRRLSSGRGGGLQQSPVSDTTDQ